MWQVLGSFFLENKLCSWLVTSGAGAVLGMMAHSHVEKLNPKARVPKMNQVKATHTGYTTGEEDGSPSLQLAQEEI